MPHYKDGSEAKVGDRVKGIAYYGQAVAGLLISVNDAPEGGYNCMVAHVCLVDNLDFEKLSADWIKPIGTPGAIRFLVLRVEYGEVRNFEKML